MVCTISYHKNNSFQGDNFKKKKARVDILSYNMPGQADIDPRQILSENPKKHRSYEAHKLLLLNFYKGKVKGHITPKER